MGGRGMKDVGGAVLAGSSSPFLGRERAAVDVDVGPERRSPRYHETCLALESVKESSAAVSKPRCVWLRVPIFKDLEKARRLPVRVEEQQAQQLAMNPPRSAGDVSHDGRQEIQLTAMVPIELPVLGNLACRLLVKIPVDVCVLLNGKSRKRGPKSPHFFLSFSRSFYGANVGGKWNGGFHPAMPWWCSGFWRFGPRTTCWS